MNRLSLLFLFACASEDVSEPAPSTETSETTSQAAELTCRNRPKSACDRKGSMVRGVARLPEGYDGPTSGDLVVYLNHASVFGNAEGGGYLHIGEVTEGVDLAGEGVEFAIDMCDGGAMWSEHNCTYAAIVLLDLNGNNHPDMARFEGNPVPDPGEPAFRVDLQLECEGDAHCLDAVLDCTDGASCVAGVEEVCACRESTCSSIAAGCQD